MQVRGQRRPPKVKGIVSELFGRRRVYIPMERVYSIDAVQVQTNDLVRAVSEEPFDVTIEPGTRRVFAIPFLRLKAIAVTFGAAPKAPLALLVRVNGNREVPLGAVSGVQATVPSPSYRVDAVILEAPREGDVVRVIGLGLETQEGNTAQASRLSAYLSQDAFQEIATTPQIRVFRVMGASPLVRGAAPVAREAGPAPGGQLEFRSEAAQTVEVALPYLNGWSGGATEFSGRFRVEAGAGAVPLAGRHI